MSEDGVSTGHSSVSETEVAAECSLPQHMLVLWISQQVAHTSLLSTQYLPHKQLLKQLCRTPWSRQEHLQGQPLPHSCLQRPLWKKESKAPPALSCPFLSARQHTHLSWAGDKPSLTQVAGEEPTLSCWQPGLVFSQQRESKGCLQDRSLPPQQALITSTPLSKARVSIGDRYCQQREGIAWGVGGQALGRLPGSLCISKRELRTGCFPRRRLCGSEALRPVGADHNCVGWEWVKHWSTATAIHSWFQHGRLCCSISSVYYMQKLPSLLGWQKIIIWQLPYFPGTPAFLWLLDSESGFFLFAVFWPCRERAGSLLLVPGPEPGAEVGGKVELAGEQSLAYAACREKGFPSEATTGFLGKQWGFWKEGQGSEGMSSWTSACCSVEEETWNLVKEEAGFVSALLGSRLGHFQLLSVPGAYRERKEGVWIGITARDSGLLAALVSVLLGQLQGISSIMVTGVILWISWGSGLSIIP